MSESEDVERAMRWLRWSYRAGALVDAVAAVGMVWPRWYGPTLRFRGRFGRRAPELAYGLRIGAPLMAGWAVLLLWADRRPLERRGVLAITIVPVLAGLLAGDAGAVRAGWLARRGVLPVRALQLGLVALFGASLVRARRAAGAPR